MPKRVRKFKIWLERNAFNNGFYPAKIFTNDLKRGNKSEGQEPTSKRSKTIPKINITIDSRDRMGKAIPWGDEISLEKRHPFK